VNIVRRAPRVRRTLLLPVAALTLITVVLYLVREQLPDFDTLLPPFVGPAGIQHMIDEPRFSGPLPDVTGLATVIQVVSVAIYLLGTWLYRRSYLRDGPVADGYLALAMLIGALGIFVPIAWISLRWDLGLLGVWTGLTLLMAWRFGTNLFRFFSRRWEAVFPVNPSSHPS